MAGTSAVFHEIRVRRRRRGGPLIRDIARDLRDQHHLFPDGLTTLQRAYRILAMEQKTIHPELSPYALSLALSIVNKGRMALMERDNRLLMPTFRGSGEDAARALLADLVGDADLQLLRLGTTEPRGSRPVVELWTVPDPDLPEDAPINRIRVVWHPWHQLLEEVGGQRLRDPTLVSSLLLLTRRRLLGQLPWIPRFRSPDELQPGEEKPPVIGESQRGGGQDGVSPPGSSDFVLEPELQALNDFLPLLRDAEDVEKPLVQRLRAASEISTSLSRIFLTDVTRLKGLVLSAHEDEEARHPIQLLDLISIRVRGMADRLYQCLNEDLLPALEDKGVQVRSWTGLMNQDRKSILRHFSSTYLPSMQVAAEWGPSFIPDMPPEGCAVGLLARTPEVEATRFFHVVIDSGTPSLISIPGTSTVLPLEEVIRGYFLTEYPELERAQTYLFRFMTGGVMVRERVHKPEPIAEDLEILPDEGQEGWEDEDLEAESREYFRTGAFPIPKFARREEPLGPSSDPEEDSAPPASSGVQAEVGSVPFPPEPRQEPPPPPPPPTPEYRRVRQSVVVRVLARRRMPESLQAQLIRALERQVSQRIPLIGWSDLYPVTGPLDLSGLDELI
jgi:hypothetical protein